MQRESYPKDLLSLEKILKAKETKEEELIVNKLKKITVQGLSLVCTFACHWNSYKYWTALSEAYNRYGSDKVKISQRVFLVIKSVYLIT
jgi:hypothetical protein